jgi:hypothetical protein
LRQGGMAGLHAVRGRDQPVAIDGAQVAGARSRRLALRSLPGWADPLTMLGECHTCRSSSVALAPLLL